MTNLTAMTLENRISDLLCNCDRFDEVFYNDLGDKIEIQVFVTKVSRIIEWLKQEVNTNDDNG